MSENRTKINWFPGHMAKTMRLIAYEIRNVEAVAEIIDARIPYSSQNPNLRRACGRKPRIFILNKADLADEQLTREWIKLFTSKGYAAIALNGKKSSEKKKLVAALDSFVEDHVRKRANEKPRIMFVGVPNVGKSTVINMLLGQNIAKVENRPGVTRGKQWLSADRFELLDMPGVLWEKFSDMSSAYNLAYTGAIRDDVFDMEEVACALLQELYTVSPQALKSRLELEEEEQGTGYELLELVARQRGFLLRGGIPDTEKAAKAVLTDLRDGKFGRVTLEAPRW
ncbi:MAG: ribosome biogenesis GTPase YlqF [Oscillospiraceae bacterium]|nr:ribosome biogenesis GTPase YlqF [Oscillospiraceae bacterium]